MKKRLILIVFVILLLGVGLLVYLGQRREKTAERYYSGTIESIESNIAFQVSGRVQEVLVDEGQAIRKDQVLARLDASTYEARVQKAAADLEQAVHAASQAEVQLATIEIAAPAAVARAEAAVRSLEANLDEMEAGYRRQEVHRAEQARLAARATLEEARRDKERYEKLFERKVVSAAEMEAYALRHETALREYERAKSASDLSREGFRKESIRAAEARLSEGRAALDEAKGNLKRIDAARAELDVARARVRAAQAALRLAETEGAWTVLAAPFDAIVTSRNVEPGEVVTPTREVLSVADLRSVELKIFVGETEIGTVKPGQNATVRTDTFPEKDYGGTVIYISPEAEFTPKIIQTHKERVKLVYLVKIALPNPDLELKPGMPADAWLQ